MVLKMRPIEPDEYPRFHRAASTTFGETPSDQEIEAERLGFEFERSLAVFEGAEIVATAGAYTFQLTLPGLECVSAAGVSYITVLPTHRRRGILTSIMRRQFADFAERGEPVAILTASESIIYGRFGFGIATDDLRISIPTEHGAFIRAIETPGRMRMLAADEARRILPVIYDAMRVSQPGALNRPDGYWESMLSDPESRRNGASALTFVVYEAQPSKYDGFVIYRVKSEWEGGFPKYTVMVSDLIGLTVEANAALWRYCLDMDLVTTVIARHRPVNEPLRWLLADPRRMVVLSYNDFLWLRLLDVSAALSARRYSTSDRLAFAVTDTFCPDTAGTYTLEGSPAEACCERSSADPDLALDVADLGAAYLGGVRFSSLARAGRVRELRPGALHRADAMFSFDPAPWCCTGF